MNTSEHILRGMALAFFASAWADAEEEAGQAKGGEIMDRIPGDIDPAALSAARTLYMQMEQANKKILSFLYADCTALDAAGADRQLSPELFGHYCAMQAMGHGVGLESFGRAVRDNVTVPYVEFGSHSLERDYFEAHDAEPEEHAADCHWHSGSACNCATD